MWHSAKGGEYQHRNVLVCWVGTGRRFGGSARRWEKKHSPIDMRCVQMKPKYARTMFGGFALTLLCLKLPRNSSSGLSFFATSQNSRKFLSFFFRWDLVIVSLPISGFQGGDRFTPQGSVVLVFTHRFIRDPESRPPVCGLSIASDAPSDGRCPPPPGRARPLRGTADLVHLTGPRGPQALTLVLEYQRTHLLEDLGPLALRR